LLKRLRLTADQVSVRVDLLADCMAKDEYHGYGSVDLADVASTMQDEITSFEEPTHCTSCNGSGEGMHDLTRCRTCHGRGELPSQREIQQHQGETA
jgi:DnaJ-class molecular chaperone